MYGLDLERALVLATTAKRYGLIWRIRREIKYQKGRKDRAEDKGCRSADGAYLNGW